MEVLNIGLDQKCPEYSSPNLTNKKKNSHKVTYFSIVSPPC